MEKRKLIYVSKKIVLEYVENLFARNTKFFFSKGMYVSYTIVLQFYYMNILLQTYPTAIKYSDLYFIPFWLTNALQLNRLLRIFIILSAMNYERNLIDENCY